MISTISISQIIILLLLIILIFGDITKILKKLQIFFNYNKNRKKGN